MPIGTMTCFMRLLRTPGQRRHALRWLGSRIPGYLLATGTPWVVYDAVDHVRRLLPREPLVFEYGSGASTIFWLRQGAKLVSIEHDPAWYEVVRRRVGKRAGFDYRLVQPEQIYQGEVDYADPGLYATEDAGLRSCSFQKYVDQIDAFPDQHFDVVFIDGRSRPACLVHGARKVKPGGMLILDNADREYYLRHTRPYLDQFTCKEFRGVVPVGCELSQTNCYLRERM